MASYNSADYIAESIESVINQRNYSNWELIISDDNSSDDTQKVTKHYSDNDARIVFLPSRKNQGAAVTRNRAIKKAKGRYIAFLDSDDLWSADKLNKQVEFMRQNNAALSYGFYNLISENGELINKKKTNLPKQIDYEGLLKNPVIGCLTAMYDTKICGKQTMPIIRKRQDFALWLKILKQGHNALCLEETIGHYRIRKESISRNKLKAALYNWRLYRRFEKLPLPKAMWVFGCYIYNKTVK